MIVNNSVNNIEEQNNVISVNKWLELCFSCRYISNSAWFIALLAYYTQAYHIFLFMVPLIINNFILVIILLWNNLDDFIIGLLNITKQNENYENIKNQFIILSVFWHIILVIWVYYILNKDNLIKLFKPNFMYIYFVCIIIVLIYFYFGSKNKIYGEINYLSYLIIYTISLLGICYYLFMINQ